jgi:beta-galactosidase
MNNFRSFFLVCLVLPFFQNCGEVKDENRIGDTVGRILIDSQWEFAKCDFKDFATSKKRIVNLPHDWSIEDIPGTNSPFDVTAVGAINTGYTVGGTACYQKELTFSAMQKDKIISIDFEGVYMNTDVYLNGEHLYNHPYGYTEFSVDITDKIDFKKSNLLVVEVKNEGRNSRWYSGSGIYRHVWLTINNPVHVKKWGTIITTPVVSSENALVLVKNIIENESAQSEVITVTNIIIDEEGKTVSEGKSTNTIDFQGSASFDRTFEVDNPELWSPETPSLYTLKTLVQNSDSEILDETETSFGIRSIEFTVEDGFLLNGIPTLLKGGCVHHDNGPLGAAAYDRAEERRVELLKASGYNAIRCAHNPPSPAFLDACDRIGMIVIDESFDMWNMGKNPQDYHLYFKDWWKKDIEAMVFRDRNHPSIIMWSTGNEIPGKVKPEVVEISQMLSDYVRELDDTRPVTAAVNGLKPEQDPYFATLDIAGYNYSFGGDHKQESIFRKDHRRVPERISYCSESYPLKAFGAWMDVIDNSYVIGDFVWTSMDYLGEASIGWNGYPHDTVFYPWNHAYCGDIDICGFKRPQSFYRDVLWQHEEGYPVSLFVHPPEPTFEIKSNRADWSKWHYHDLVSDWNWEGLEGKELEVTVFSMYPEVELYLNGKSHGRKQTTRETEWKAKYVIQYEPGALKAVGYTGDEIQSDFSIITAKEPTQIILSPDRPELKANGRDLCFVTIELQDENGNINPKSDDLIQFEIDGPGEIIAVGR